MNSTGSANGSSLLLMVVLAMANFMQVLDLAIANVSLPAITGDLGAAPSQGAWIITSYAVANAIMVPLTGWLAGRFGQVRLFVLATLTFTLASLFCGLAWDLPSLIAFRVVQGAAGGLMIPLSQALLLSGSPPEKRGMALTMWSMTTTVAPITGPILGGWITDNHHWSWIFLINVPVGLVAAAATWQMLKHRETPVARLPLDRVGVALLVLWVGCLQVVLDKGNELDWFDSNFIVCLSLVAALGFALFMVWELTERHPVIDLSLFRIRNFLVAVTALSLSFCVFRGTIVILPLWLQTQVGYTAQWAGYVLVPTGMVAILLSPFVGRHVHRAPRLIGSFAIAVFAVCSFWRAHFTAGADYYHFALPQLLQGLAMATFFAPLVSISLGGIEPGRMAAATGMQNFVRNMFGSFGTSLSITFWERREVMHRSHLAERASAISPGTADYLAQLGSAGIPADQAHALIERSMTVQAYTLATNDLYWASGALLLVLVGIIWLSKPPFGLRAGAGGG